MSPVQLIKRPRMVDPRGWFSETYNHRDFAELGITVDFVQDNHSLSRRVGTLRGLHFQIPPRAQAKLVRCVRGRIWDVVVDVRKGSPTYGRWTSAELDAEASEQLFIPVGFAHGFVTLEPDTEVIYKVSDYYDPQCDRGLRADDGDLAIKWPLPPGGAIVSEKDANLPLIKDFDSPFGYDGVPLRGIGKSQLET